MASDIQLQVSVSVLLIVNKYMMIGIGDEINVLITY